MNKEIKAKWVADLRSGEYVQGKGCLRSNNDEFCCLGVLVDLYHKETGKGKWIDHNDIKSFKLKNETMDGLPDKSIYDWAEMGRDNTDYPTRYIPEIQKTLNGMNDDGTSFKEIADIIEQYL